MPHLDNCSFSARRDKMGLAPDTVKLLFSLEVMDKRRAGYLLQAEYPVVRIGGDQRKRTRCSAVDKSQEIPGGVAEQLDDPYQDWMLPCPVQL